MKSLPKHNISSILSLWQANVTELRLFCFFSPLNPHSNADSMKCASLNRMTEQDWKKVRKRRQQIVTDAECCRKLEEEEKRERKEDDYSPCFKRTTFWAWNKSLCWISVRFEPRGEEKSNAQWAPIKVSHKLYSPSVQVTHISTQGVLWGQKFPHHTNTRTTRALRTEQAKQAQKKLRAFNRSEASSIQGVGADWRSGPE